MKEKKVSYKKILTDGIITNNPTFIQLLGMCSTLAITTSVINGIGMGFCVTFVLIFSNLFISVLRKFIPKQIRIASYVVVIAGFVTVIDLLMKAYVPDLSKSLGLFIPLIVVNCVILARAESFASKYAVAVCGGRSGDRIGFYRGADFDVGDPRAVWQRNPVWRTGDAVRL